MGSVPIDKLLVMAYKNILFETILDYLSRLVSTSLQLYMHTMRVNGLGRPAADPKEILASLAVVQH